MEDTIKNNESKHYLMLCNGGLVNLGILDKNIDIDKEYGDECIVLKISNFEDLN